MYIEENSFGLTAERAGTDRGGERRLLQGQPNLPLDLCTPKEISHWILPRESAYSAVKMCFTPDFGIEFKRIIAPWTILRFGWRTCALMKL